MELSYDVPAPARGAEISARLSQLSGLFAQNVAAATADWSHPIADEAALQGMREQDKRRARWRAQRAGSEGFLLGLDAASYAAVLRHADDRKLRHDVYEAYVTRASDHGPRAGRFDNTPLVQEMLTLRHELARLRGFANYAELALSGSVLQRPDDVERYLLHDGAAARTRAQAELDAIWAFAKTKGVPKAFSTWDLDYYAAWLRREQLGFDEDDLRVYFALPEVLAGLFVLSERLLGVRVGARADEPRSFRLIAGSGVELGLLQLDAPTATAGLYGVRAVVCRGHADAAHVRVRCDLGSVGDDQPVLLSYADVCALFRCVGSGLGLLLSRANKQGVATSTTASHIVGNLFERFCAHFDTLGSFARHHVSGAPLPRALFDQLMRSRELHAGLAAAAERELSLFDLRVHRDYVPAERSTQLRAHVLDTLAQVRREVCVLRPPFWERLANTCTEIFVEDRAVRLWELTWAKQIAAELFAQLAASGFAYDRVRRQRNALWSASEHALLDRLTVALGRRPLPLP